MYYPFFLTYILTGLFIGGTVFYWALKSGQFSDQQRARFLALEDIGPQAGPTSMRGRYQLYFIFSLALAAILASIALLGYALFFS
ncbi:MAG: cbb3-type cytochrome oxidase assembly protein CcoS [Deltaproteobacteria bacterium]|jgi:cbb3-type cytochrome oxidase maturation protein|nr:cbb3-type cytochrome oxidase assembly protein CcoS [Deltaproteobacteria bacterium]